MWQGGSRLAWLRLPHARVNDGAWHHLQLELRGAPGRAPPATLLLLALDYGRHQVMGMRGRWGRAQGGDPPGAGTPPVPAVPWGWAHSEPLSPQAVADVAGGLQGLRLRTLSVGGLAGDSGQVEQGFRGCLQVRGDMGHRLASGRGAGAWGRGAGHGDMHRAWGHGAGEGDMGMVLWDMGMGMGLWGCGHRARCRSWGRGKGDTVPVGLRSWGQGHRLRGHGDIWAQRHNLGHWAQGLGLGARGSRARW